MNAIIQTTETTQEEPKGQEAPLTRQEREERLMNALRWAQREGVAVILVDDLSSLKDFNMNDAMQEARDKEYPAS